MKTYIISILIILPLINGFAQGSRVLVQNSKSTSNALPIVNVKWYNQQLTYKRGVNIYRREIGEDVWIKLNPTPIVLQQTVPSDVLQRDEDLQAFVDMAKEVNVAEEDGFLLLTLFGKSFQSHDYSRLIGIQYDDSNATWGKVYQYRVTKLERNEEIELAISPSIRIGEYQKEDSIQDLSVVLHKNVARMKWREEEDRFYGVNVYRSTTKNLSWRKINSNPVIQSESDEGPKAEVMFEDDSLQEGTIYYYKVAGLDFFGEETLFTNSREIKVGDLTPPLPPLNPIKTVKVLNVSVSWEIQPTNDLAGFHVYRSVLSDGPFERITKIMLSNKDSVFIDSVPHAGFYYYYIAAIDESGNEGNSFTILAEVQDVIPPMPPSQVKARADTGKIILSWKSNDEPDLAGYHIFRAVSEASDSQFVLINSDPLTDTTYTQVFAKNASNKFLFKIVSVDTSYNRSEPSEIVSARMPDVTPPIKPMIKNILIRGDTIEIQWLGNPERDIKAFVLYRSDKGEHERVVSSSINPSARHYSDTILSAGNYSYRLQAIDESGNRSLLSDPFPVLKSNVFRFSFKEVKGKYKKMKRAVVLAWSVNGTPKGYSVFRKKVGEDINWKPVTGLIREEEFVDKSMLRKITYQYQVRAYSNEGEVVMSQAVEFITK